MNNEKTIHVQVALDVAELNRALEIAKEAVSGGVDWIEAGTPLIKSEGMNAVRELRKLFPNNVILADMKTMDAGAAEVEMAAKSGADIVIILAASDDSVISESLKSARKYGVRIMADLLSVKDPKTRVKELENLGVDLINVHIGIDQQMTGKSPLESLKSISENSNLEIAVAGGLRPETAAQAVKYGADIIIVGSYITNSADVEKSAEEILKHVKAPDLIETVKKKSRTEEIIEIFKRVSTSNISDAMHRKGAMEGIHSIFPGKKIVGKAFTVQTLGGDWAKPVEAIDKAGPGDVLVIYGGNKNISMWGGLATLSAKKQKIEGVVIDGAIRDFNEIKEIDFPVFASNVVPNAGEPKGMGEIQSEIKCGNQTVNPGDFIIGDDSGVVVVPKEIAYEIARRSEEVEKREQRIFDEIERGSTLSKSLEILKWEKTNK
ncbi:MAG: bifunctional hexulose-6-phosphate synthase/ribonuclease regulator [Methanosarcinaceae archaeon]|nr:bifunctional hexulose-6-phosphate synthase/ribonuclease regulator [Methanosarcinaceae archaeon]